MRHRVCENACSVAAVVSVSAMVGTSLWSLIDAHNQLDSARFEAEAAKRELAQCRASSASPSVASLPRGFVGVPAPSTLGQGSEGTEIIVTPTKASNRDGEEAETTAIETLTTSKE